MRRVFQRRYVLGAFVVLLIAGTVGAWTISRSDRTANLVAQKIESRVGMPVRLSQLLVGWSQTGVRDLQLFERDAQPEYAQPWISVPETQLDISPLSATFGRTPSQITLREPHLRLRFNREGDLISQFGASTETGGPIPTIQIISGDLTLAQEGRPDSYFHGINLTITEEDGKPVVRGLVHDNSWGTWSVDGSVNSDRKIASMTLQATEPREITPELLVRTPFVNPNAWKAVTLHGTSGAKLDVQVDLATEKLTYRMAMTPTNTSIDIPSVGMHFQEAHGELYAEAAHIQLKNVRGKISGGSVRLNSEMEFIHPDKDILNFHAEVTDVDVQKLPNAWRIPDEIEGDLKGTINFSVTLFKEGGVKTDGRGEGLIERVKINGVNADPIPLSVRPSLRGGFELVQKKSVTSATGVVLTKKEVLVPEPTDPKKADHSKPGIMTLMLKGIAGLVKPADAPKAERGYLTFNLSLTDVNVTDVLKSLNINLPIKLDGKVSVKFEVQVPTETPNDFSTYRLSGLLTSSKLIVEDMPLEAVKMDLRVRDGNVVLQDLSARLPGTTPDAPIGELNGKGNLSLDNDYGFKASFKLDKIALEHLDEIRELVPLSVQISGTVMTVAVVEGTLKPFQLKSAGTLKATGMKVGPFPIGQLTAKWDSDLRAIQFTDVSAKLFEGELTGSFAIPFRPDVAAEANLKLTKINLGEVTKNLPLGNSLMLEGTAGGDLAVRIPAAGEGGPRQAIAEMELRAPKLKLQNFPAERIKVDARFVGGVARYKVSGDALGGQFEVEGQYPPAPPKKVVPKKEPDLPLGKIRLKNVKLSKIIVLAGLKNTLGPLDADIDGIFPLTTENNRIVGVGQIRATRIRWAEQSIALIGEGIIRLTPTEVRLEEFTIPSGDGIARGSATFDRNNIDRSRGTLTLSNFPSETLFFPVPDVAKWVKCKFNGELVTTLGREWRGSGVLIASQGTIYKMPVQEARFPLDWIALPEKQRAELHIRDLVGSAARGRITGKAEANFFADSPTRLNGELKFSNLNLSTVFQSTSRVIGSTPISGTFTFGSEGLRTSDDLTGKLTAKSGEATPFGLPVLSQTLAALGMGNFVSAPISNGELKSTLKNGLWTIERLVLTGSALDVYVEGTISNSGRLNLHVAGTAGRSDYGSNILSKLGSFASQIASQPLNPTSAQQAIALLGNFVVYVDVTGTTDQPLFRLQALRTLSEDALRFFLLRYLPR